MNTWVPLWTSTVQSTLWEEPVHVRVMFLTMLLLRDPDQVVRMPFRRLVKAANLAMDIQESAKLAEEALRVLSEPDSRSIDNQEFGGRRIRQQEDGWLILNGAKYQEEMVKLTARVRKTQKQKERRDQARKAKGSGALPGESAAVKAMSNGDQRLADRIAEESLPERRRPQPVDLRPLEGEERF